MHRTSYTARAAALAGLLLLSVPAAAQRSPKAGGDTVSKSMLAATRFAPVGDLRTGQTVQGRLQDGDSILADDSSYVDAYRYQGRSGERITVRMESPDFDTYLAVRMGGQIVGVNDDGAGGTNSSLTIDLPLDAEYSINANSLRKGMTGRYTISLVSQGATTASVDTVNWARRYPGGGSPGDRYAVLVGIATYPHALGADLDGPAQDVREMRDVLVNRYGFKPENVLVLMNREANRRQILEAAQRHLGQAGPNGVAVFYYSGHGTQLDANYGDQDAEPDGKDEAIVVWGQGEDGGSLILDDELGAVSDRLRAGRALFVLDACHSGTGLRADLPHDAKFLRFAAIRNHTTVPRTWLRSPGGPGEHALAGDLDARGAGRAARKRLLLAASTETEVSWISRGPWPDGVRSSVFTHYLVDELSHADPGVTFRSAMQLVGGATDRYTRKFQHTGQTPQAEGTHLDEAIDAFLSGR
ncbi:MAG: hypothetical protein JWM27_3357 [Gemmatimonadetes bacterium]|nr:hypothetical protein [Gemmatimonadota bacterium]